MSKDISDEDIDRMVLYRAPDRAIWHVVIADDRFMAFRFGPFTGADIAPIWKRLRDEEIKHLVVCESSAGFDWEVVLAMKSRYDPNAKLVNLAQLLIGVMEATEAVHQHTAPDDCVLIDGTCAKCEAKVLARDTIAEMNTLIETLNPKRWIYESKSTGSP